MGTERTTVIRILLVDDDLTVLRAMKRLLERSGHQVVDASDGEMALARAREEDVDLLLTDILMPGMDGIALATSMKEQLPGMPVLFNTGGCPAGLRHQAERMGRVLDKGMPPRAIREAIKEAMAGTGPAGAALSNTS